VRDESEEEGEEGEESREQTGAEKGKLAMTVNTYGVIPGW